MTTKPYYLQEESDDEGEGGGKHAHEHRGRHKEKDEGAGGQEAAEGFAVGGDGSKARLGRVEIDPDIDYADWTSAGPGLESRANLDKDGMINVWVNLKKQVPELPKDYARPVKEWALDEMGGEDCPPLNVVIFIVGSRGDVQPYLSLALRMISSHAHRVRIATHPDFKDFVLDANARLKGKTARGIDLEGRLEFFDVGGDPKELMAFMVKNPGLMPGWASLTNGDIGSKRRMTATLLEGFYKSTYEADPVSQRPFAADAIISNPPAFGHVHIAEALGLPLLMTFTMPWSPTTSFNHPLVNVKQSNAEKGLTNYLSYALADMLQWQGLGDVINLFRTGTLGLPPLTIRSGAGVLDRLKVPYTYTWSQGLIPKPDDWKENIDISGFFFFEGDSDFKPEDDLEAFLKGGDAPIYIGFGSVVVEDAAEMTKTIFEAVKKAGVRALVSAGWGGLGGTEVTDEVFILKGSIPHDWLFAEGRISAVCHHGGAGTTAIGLRNGLPTIVVPFFGDQKFWGDMIHRAGGGPEPIPQKTLTADNLSEAIKYALSDEAKKAAGVMGETIRKEDGEDEGVKSFHRHLPLKNMRCDIDPSHIGSWWSEELCLRLSSAVAGLAAEERSLDFKKLKPLRSKEYPTKAEATDPISGGAAAILRTITNHYAGIAQIFYNPPKGIVNTTTAIPQGMLDIIVTVYEGFDAIPKRIGSSVRERGPIEDIQTGLREGGKGLWWGWWDGITGLVTEPVEGAKKEGLLGAIKGAGRGIVNVHVRPAIGILGMMALPASGAWKSLLKQTAGAPGRAVHEPRVKLSKEAASALTQEERQSLLERFDEAVKGAPERKERMRKRVKLFLSGDESALDPEVDVSHVENEPVKAA